MGAFNAYSDKLHSLGALITLAEIGLLVLAIIHIFFESLLYFENWRASALCLYLSCRSFKEVVHAAICLMP